MHNVLHKESMGVVCSGTPADVDRSKSYGRSLEEKKIRKAGIYCSEDVRNRQMRIPFSIPG